MHVIYSCYSHLLILWKQNKSRRKEGPNYLYNRNTATCWAIINALIVVARPHSHIYIHGNIHLIYNFELKKLCLSIQEKIL